MTFETLRYDVADGILTLTLHRPEQLNVISATMIHELLDAFDRADADDEVRAVVVTGAGRVFCAGADLSSGEASFDPATWGEPPDAEKRDAGGRVTLRLFELKKPVIAAVNGPAVGFGATLLLPMDARLAADDARFGFVFTRRGIVPEACSSWFLPRLVGIDRALDWTLSGRVFAAQEALDGGLVRSLHPAQDLLAAARQLALEWSTATSAVSVALTRQMMWRMLGADHPMEAHKVDSRGMYAMGTSEDCKEGVTAFL
ncbi:MAG: enoyl-CoA hydratase-related protein, partial [Acidobacteriota bacterium]